MTDGMDSMMWGVGLVGLLIIVLLVLSGAALVKFLFFEGRKNTDVDGAAGPDRSE